MQKITWRHICRILYGENKLENNRKRYGAKLHLVHLFKLENPTKS